MGRLQDESVVNDAGNRINSGRRKINSATQSIGGVKADMIALRNEVDASVVAADGLYSATDQAEVQAVLVEFKGLVTSFAAGL